MSEELITKGFGENPFLAIPTIALTYRYTFAEIDVAK